MKICLLIVDCLRPDHLGCYGYDNKTSPNIDRIAGQGAQGVNVYAQSNWTYPSVYSMLTGRYPSVLNVTWFDQKINRAFKVLPEVLAKHGFRSDIFSNFKVLLNKLGFCSHFDGIKEVKIDENGLSAFTGWANSDGDAFLFYHIGEYVHEPYFADDRLVDRFLEDKDIRSEALRSEVVRVLTERGSTGNSIRRTVGRVNKRLASLSPAEIEYLFACYDAGISHVDTLIGHIHDILREQNDEYIFIVTADHGQAFLEHGLIGHGLSLYEEVVRVPLIIDYPGCVPVRIQENLQLADLFPTLLEMLQIDHDIEFEGRSFVGGLSGKDLPQRYAFVEGFPNVALIRDGHKLISSYSKHWSGREVRQHFSRDAKTFSFARTILSGLQKVLPARLYDVKSDIKEKNNLHRRRQDVYRELNVIIRDILTEIQKKSLPSETKTLDENVREQLEKLGYL